MRHEKTLQDSYELLRRNQVAAAEKLCRNVLAVAPSSADALHLLGLIRKQSGDLDSAEQLLRRSVATDASRAERHANLGNLLRARGKLAEAESAYRTALNVDPAFRAARLGLARLMNDLERHAEAEAEARRLLAANARDPEAWNVLGSAQRGLADAAAAETAFRTALEIAPSYGAARHNLGALLSSLERAEEALVELDRAASAGIQGWEIAYNRGRAHFDLAQFDRAEAAFEQAVASDAGHVASHTTLAKLRFMRGDPDYARSYEAARRQRPDDLRLRLGHADVLRLAGDAAAAESLLREIESAAGLIPEVSAALAIVLHEQGRLDEAAAQARAAFEARPGSAGIAEKHVVLLLTLGHGEEALPIILDQRQRAPRHQRWLAYEATAKRIAGDAAYHQLYDYERFVRSFDLPAPAGWPSTEAFNAALGEVLDRLHRLEARPLDQSLRFGTQTPRNLLAEPDPLIQQFLRWIEIPIAEYRAALPANPDHPFLGRNTGGTRMRGCWSVRLQKNGYHVNHVHPEGWISSAYYVSVPPETADADLRSGWIKFGEPGLLIPGLGPELFVQPRAGRLVLFPSYLWHGTTPITGDAPRLTIAFDAVPTSE